MSFALGEDREGKKKVKRKASEIQSSRIGSALVCVRQNLQHRELNLPESKLYLLIAIVMAAASTSEPTGCLVSFSPRSSQNVQSHETSSASHRTRGETQP